MSRPELEALQLERLKRMVNYCYENVPFYHERLEKAGVTGDKIKTLSDIQYIPFTTKDDIRDNYPFNMLATPMKKIVRIHASSGTTGKPTVGAYTKGDLDNWSDNVARVAAAAGASEDDIFQISFGYGLFTVAAAALPSVSAATASAETTATGSNIGPAPLPPGAGDLDRFLDTCTACGLCISACPSHVLRPSYTSLGWKGLMKPYLDYSVGFCQPDCHSCSQVCPTGALLPLSLAEKKATQIGIVDFRQEHCIVWHQDRDCCDCADACPTGAIEAVEVKRPVVDPNKCTGCRGKRCFNACPTGSISYIIREDTGRRLAVVNYDTCIGCGYCAEACSKRHAIDVSVHRAPKLHPERCTGCGSCTHVCPASPAKAMRVHPRIRHLQLQQSDATA